MGIKCRPPELDHELAPRGGTRGGANGTRDRAATVARAGLLVRVVALLEVDKVRTGSGFTGDWQLGGNNFGQSFDGKAFTCR